jgi:hypothetical protein
LETKNYMIVLDDKCKKCNYSCNAIYFLQNFNNWTSGNNDIDEFIQDTQLSAHKTSEISYALEWLPFDKFQNIKYIATNEFGNIFRANWIDGYIYELNEYNQNWKRKGQNMFVNLKSLSNNPKTFILKFANKV